jgi:MFS family permease
MPKQTSRSPYLIIALISIPIFIGAMDLTVVSAVLPHVIYDLQIPLQTGLDKAAWVVTGYLLVYSIAMLFMGRLSDLHGRRKVFLLALSIFALGSLMVAISDTWLTRNALRLYYLLGGSQRLDASQTALDMIIFTRMVQAFGGGAMVPVGMALVGDIFPMAQRGRAIGMIAAIDTAGWVVGHLYGGIIVRYFSWHVIFWLNLPVCLLGLILIATSLHDLPQERVKGRMDWLGVVLASGFLTALTVGLGSGSEVNLTSAEQSTGPPYNLPALGAALIFLIVLAFQQSRTRQPLINLSLFRKRNFSFAILANFLVGASLFIAIANVPLYINSLVATTLEQGAWESGWVLSALTIPIAFASIPGGWLTEKRSYRLPALLGLIMAIAGFALMSRWQIETTYSNMIPQLVLAGIGIGLTIAPISTAVINASPPSSRGIASAFVLTFRLIGMTVGVSSMTTFGLHRADVLTARLIPAGTGSSEAVHLSMSILMSVINETFLIAGALCLLAVIGVFFLKNDSI